MFRKTSPFWVRLVAGLLPVAFVSITFAGDTKLDRANEPTRQIASQRVVDGMTAEDRITFEAELHAWLMAELPQGALKRPVKIELTAAELDGLANPEVTTSGPLRVGMVKPVAREATLSNLHPKNLTKRSNLLNTGVLRKTDDGGFVWAVSVTSPEAAAIRVHFTEFDIPSDAEVYFFSLEGEAHGPYTRNGLTGTGDFWSHSIRSSTGVVLLRYFGPGGAEGIKDVSLRISDIGHIGVAIAAPGDGGVAQLCSYNASCIVGVNQTNTDPATNDAQAGVAMIRFISGAFINLCSGGLIGDSAGSQTPYFLTANHCVSKGGEASSMEAFFLFSSGCLSDPFRDDPPVPTTLGATILVKNRTSDFTLLQLNQAAPNGTTFMGWNSTNIANSNGTALFRIAHPAGAPQAYSEHVVDTSRGTCRGWPRGAWIYSSDTEGATEGGSSGSPVVNAGGQIVGQLSGGCGFNVGDPCDSVANATVDGSFAAYFSQVSSFLDPVGCNPSPEVCDNGIDDDCDGDVDCNDADCSGDPACSCSPSTEVCDDGIDNDCDGATDCNDSDCSSDPACNCTLGQVGDSCVDAADCCSNKCKGRSGNKTCK